MTRSLRELLTENGFDWENGKVIIEQYNNGRRSGQFMTGSIYLHDDETAQYIPIENNSELLDDSVLHNGWNQDSEHYQIIAYDKEKIYFTAEYDGSTWIEWFFLNPESYKDYIFKSRV